MRATDVVVVGGGPAGAAAAIRLAQQGREVMLVDKAAFPRDKICGDGLTAGALRLLEQLGLDPAGVPSWQRVDDIVVHAPTGREITLPLPRGQGLYAAVATRFELDAALLDLARTAGVRVLDGHACTGAEERNDRVVLEVEGVGAIAARYAIGADGVWSPLRKHLGAALPGYLGDAHAFRQYFAHVGPHAAGAIHVWFEPDLLPGFAWSFPLSGGRANVGFGIHRDRGRPQRIQDMKQTWPDLLARPHIAEVLGPDARPESPHRAWPIPARIDDIPLTTRRTLFVGDAAAATDPLTGEGIGQALLTGMLAADAIGEGGLDAARTTARYEELVRKALVADHKMAIAVLRLLRGPRSSTAALRLTGATPWTRRHCARWVFEDYPRGILTTPRRWERGLLSRPGAYTTL